MEPFTLNLDDGGRTTGLVYLPPQRGGTQEFVPLIVCLHGGSYDAEYFDCDPEHSIASVASALKIPVVSITRPGYCNSTNAPSQSDGDDKTYAQQQGHYLNSTVLPAVWKRYGPDSSATAVVLLSHSIGAMMAIIAAGFHASCQGYPLAGLILAGIGSKHEAQSKAAVMGLLISKPDMVNFDPGLKDALMLALPQKNLTNPGMAEHTARLNKPLPFGEVHDINVPWLGYWHRYATAIEVPVMYSIGEVDSLWVSAPDAVQEFRDAFTSSSRVEAAVLPMAPHCIELSRHSRGWLTRCCGFALECVAERALAGNP
ncbi:hypothetical protein LTS15_002095 [Exophiala xenobiotica]|nr:hypothetical protein LTS15_002095 [Exophiala xenobiotica]